MLKRLPLTDEDDSDSLSLISVSAAECMLEKQLNFTRCVCKYDQVRDFGLVKSFHI